MKRIPRWLRPVGWLAGIAAIAYGLDWVSVLANVPARPRFSTFTISRFYLINENFNKFSYESRPSIDEQCVNALFPHFGDRPCWYVRKHTRETTEVGNY